MFNYFLIIFTFHYFSMSEPLHECPFNYYYNKGIQINNFVDFSNDCSEKDGKDHIYEKEFYIKNTPCTDFSHPSKCEGTLENPIDSFWKLIKKIHFEDQAEKYQEIIISIYFIGNPHYILNDELLYNTTANLRLFRKFNIHLEIRPFFCSLSSIPGCLDENKIIEIYLKTDLFQIEIGKYLKISNFRIIGNDLVFFENFTCTNTAFPCCNDSPNNSLNDCNIKNNKINILNSNFDLNSLFILEGAKIPLEIMIINVIFENINSIREDRGWRSLFLIQQKFYNISFINVGFYLCSLSHGFLYERNDNYSESQNIQNTTNIFVRNVSWNNVSIEGESIFTFYFDNGSTGIRFSFFHYEFSEQIYIKINKLKVFSIDMREKNKNVNYFIFDFDDDSIIDLFFYEIILQNITGYAFIKMKNSLMSLNNFKITNCKIYQTAFFFLDKSIMIMNLGLLNEIEIFLDAPFFTITNRSFLYFNSTYVQKFSNTFLNSYQSSLMLLNSFLMQIQLLNFDFFIKIVDTNLNITKTNINNIILTNSSQSFIRIFSHERNIVLVYQKGRCLNIKARNFFIYQALSLNVSMYLEVKELEFVGIQGVNDLGDIRKIFCLINSKSAIELILINQINAHNFDQFSLLQIIAPFFNISANEISLNNFNSYNSFFIQIQLQKENVFDYNEHQSFLNINNFTMINACWDLPIVLLDALASDCNVSLQNSHLQNIYFSFFFKFLSEKNKLKITIKNFYFFEIFPTSEEIPSCFLHLFYTALDSLIISNVKIANCTNMIFVYIQKPFISILINDIIMNQIFNDKYYFLMFGFSIETQILNFKNSILKLNNFDIKNSYFSTYPFSGIHDVSHPFLLEFQNIYLKNFYSWSLFTSIGKPENTVKVFFSNISLISLNFYFNLLYCENCFNHAVMQNISFFETSYIVLVDLRFFFKSLLLNNIFISNLNRTDYYMIICTQQQSGKTEETSILEITNTTFVNIGFDPSYYSPISLILVWDITSLIISNFQLINVLMGAPDIKVQFLCLEVANVKSVIINSFSFLQTVLINLDQVLRIDAAENYLKISNSRFEIQDNGKLRKFQALVTKKCKYVEFLNNTVIGMSTLARPEYPSEESGALSFFADSTYVQNMRENYSLFFKNNKIQENFGIKYGTIGIVGFSYVFLDNNTMVKNIAYFGGDLAFISIKKLFINNLSIFNSKANFNGGSIYIFQSDQIDITNSVFCNTTAYNDGGSFYIRDIRDLRIQNISIGFSFAIKNGGSFYIAQVENSQFINIRISNSTSTNGGTFYFDDRTNSEVLNSNFKYSNSRNAGGFAYISGDKMNISLVGNSIINAFSYEEGGVIHTSNIDNLTFKSNKFIDSYVKNNGIGLIYLEGFSANNLIRKTIFFENNLFFNNSALFGSNIYYSSNSLLILKNSSSVENKGSLFSFESDSFGDIIFENCKINLTNLYYDDINLNSLFMIYKISIIIMNTDMNLNFGNRNLFECFTDVQLMIKNSNILDFFSQNISNQINQQIFFRLTKTNASFSNNYFGYSKSSNFNDQLPFFELLSTKFQTQEDTFAQIISKNVKFLFSFKNSKITINFPRFENINVQDSYFNIEKSDFLLLNLNISLKSLFKSTFFLIHRNLFMGLDIMELENCTFVDVNINVLDVRRISFLSIKNTIFSGSEQEDPIIIRALYLENIKFCSFKNIQISNFVSDVGAGIYLTVVDANSNSSVDIFNSKFSNNLALTATAIYIRGHINLRIKECHFYENKAIVSSHYISNYLISNAGKAGCILVDCESFFLCSVEIVDSVFNANFAGKLGPTILSKTAKALVVENSVFSENHDGLKFTTSLAGLPMQIKENTNFYLPSKYFTFISDRIYEVVSGQRFFLSFSLIDIFNQIIFTENAAQAILSCPDITSRLIIDRGNGRAMEGVINFTDIKIIYYPNSTLNCQILFFYNEAVIFETYREIQQSLTRTVLYEIKIRVRECIVGEVHQPDDTCYECPVGKYSLKNPNILFGKQIKCIECPLNAFCPGGNQIIPGQGYWRSSNYSSLILKCPSAVSCLGMNGKSFFELTEDEKVHGICGNNYKGNFCYSCRKGYARYQVNSECLECEKLFIIYIKMAVSMLFIVGYIVFQVNFFSKSKQNDPHETVLMKLLLNHIQNLSLMKFTDYYLNVDLSIFNLIEDYFQFISEDFFIIDCLIQDIDQELFIKKIVFTSLLPVILAFLMILFWSLIFIYLIAKKKAEGFNQICNFLIQKMTMTLIIIIFVLYSEIIKKCFSLLNCIRITENDSQTVLVLSPDIVCWTSTHQFWIIHVALPGLMFWGILIPLILIFILWKYKKIIYHHIYTFETENRKKNLRGFALQEEIVYKRCISIDLERELAEKLFLGGVLPKKKIVNYRIIKKNCKVFQTAEFFIKSSEEIIKSFIPIKNIIKKNELFMDTDTIIKDPAKIYEFLDQDFKPHKAISEEDLRFHILRIKIVNIELVQAIRKYKTSKRISHLSANSMHKNSLLLKNISFIFPGYRKECYYWEVVILSRKFSLTLISTYNELFPNYIKPGLLLLILFIFIIGQLYYLPYHYKYMNKLENVSLITSFFSIGLLMVSLSETMQNHQPLIISFFFFSNGIFFVYWTYFVIRSGNFLEKMKIIVRIFNRKLRKILVNIKEFGLKKPKSFLINK